MGCRQACRGLLFDLCSARLTKPDSELQQTRIISVGSQNLHATGGTRHGQSRKATQTGRSGIAKQAGTDSGVVFAGQQAGYGS